ncbi:hypothetical protein K431DRAFT_232871, partial [Polychaeton citri CBS 116435]
PPTVRRSVISVLRTALPTSLIYEALTNPAAVSSEIASEFAAGQTPSWYSALPSDVQTILQPNASAIATGLSSSITSYPNATAITGNSTVLPTGGLGNGTSGSNFTTSSRSGSGSGSQSTSTGNGATLPTAVFGMGLAGAAGLMGMLVL